MNKKKLLPGTNWYGMIVGMQRTKYSIVKPLSRYREREQSRGVVLVLTVSKQYTETTSNLIALKLRVTVNLN